MPTSYSDGTQEVNTLLSSKSDDGKTENELRKRNSQQQLYENGRKSLQVGEEVNEGDESAGMNQSLVTSSPKITVV